MKCYGSAIFGSIFSLVGCNKLSNGYVFAILPDFLDMEPNFTYVLSCAYKKLLFRVMFYVQNA